MRLVIFLDTLTMKKTNNIDKRYNVLNVTNKNVDLNIFLTLNILENHCVLIRICLIMGENKNQLVHFCLSLFGHLYINE